MRARRTVQAALAGLSIMVVVPAAQAITSTSPVTFGVVDSRLIGANQSEIDAVLNQDATLGVTAIRQQLSWSTVEPRPGEYEWGAFDLVARSVAAHHMTLLALVDFTPSWARPAGCFSYRCGPADPNQFAAFAAAAAHRYGSLVSTWEIWNEPNSVGFWAPRPDPVAYGQLLQDSAAAIRAQDPGAYVISGGLAPEPDSSGNISPISYLSQVCATGALTSVDAVGMHPYSYPAMPDDQLPGNPWQQMNNTSTSLRSVMSACGVGSKPIWITEYGAPTNGPGASSPLGVFNAGAQPTHVSEAAQAAMISQAVSDVKSYGWVGGFFVYSATDRGTMLTSTQNFYGLRHHNGTPKPAWGAYATAISS